MKVWRICKSEYADSAFDGIGAKRAGGRWNSRGNAVVYCSESLALSVLEILVHLNIADQPPNLVAIWAKIPDGIEVESLDVDQLPDDWRRATGHPELVNRGDRWKESQTTAVLRIPSVVIPQEDNVLLNPDHVDFSAIEVGERASFSFDDRLFAV